MFQYKANKAEGETVVTMNPRARLHPNRYQGPTGHKFMVYFDGDERKVFPSYQLHPKPWHKFVGRGTKMIVTTEESLRFEDFMKALWQAEALEQQEEVEEENDEESDEWGEEEEEEDFEEEEGLDEEESEEEEEEEDTEN